MTNNINDKIKKFNNKIIGNIFDNIILETI